MKYKPLFVVLILLCLMVSRCTCNHKNYVDSSMNPVSRLKSKAIGSYIIRQDLSNADRKITISLKDSAGNPLPTFSLLPEKAAAAISILRTGKARYDDQNHISFDSTYEVTKPE